MVLNPPFMYFFVTCVWFAFVVYISFQITSFINSESNIVLSDIYFFLPR